MHLTRYGVGNIGKATCQLQYISCIWSAQLQYRGAAIGSGQATVSSATSKAIPVTLSAAGKLVIPRGTHRLGKLRVTVRGPSGLTQTLIWSVTIWRAP